MPKSKRDKKITLSKTKKKGGLVRKQQFMELIRNSIEEYNNIFVFSVKDMRNSKLKDLRDEWKDSRFYFYKNSIMRLALGMKKETEAGDDLHKLAAKLTGQCGLLLTNRPKDEVLSWFEAYSEVDYARSGDRAKSTIVLPVGPLAQFSFTMEPYLRKLGMPTKLDTGVIHLLKEFEVSIAGKLLTPEQAKILKLLEVKMATFKLNFKGVWTKDNGGHYTTLKSKPAAKETKMAEEEGKEDEDAMEEDAIQLESDDEDV